MKKFDAAIKLPCGARSCDLVDNPKVGTFQSRINGEIIYVNRAIARMFDFDSPQQMQGKSSIPFWKNTENREQLLDQLREYGEVSKFEAECSTRSGQTIYVLFSATIREGIISGQILDITERRELEKKLRDSELHLQRAQEVANFGSWDIDLQSGDLFWSDETCRIFGIPPGRPLDYGEFLQMVVPEDRAVVEQSWKFARKGEPYDIKHRVEVNGVVKWLREKSEVEFNAAGRPIRAIGVVQDISERERAAEVITDHQRRLKGLASQLVLVEERERRRVATDLHDGPAQSLAFARIELAAAMKVATDQHVISKLDSVSKILRESIRQIREVLLDLSSPAMNEIGLGAALSEWTEQAGRLHGVKINFSDESGGLNLSKDHRAVLFRNVRELLSNTFKHAQANKTIVRIVCDDSILRIKIEDNGVGFESELSDPLRESYGLLSVKESMLDLGGTLEIESKPGKGCRATLVLPVNNVEGEE
jgi:PAS domain S-box-containing protein